MKGTHVFERDGRVYIVGAVAPVLPTETDLEEMAFVSDLRKMAPNEHLAWYQGRYVEGDNPNANGAEWSTKTLSIASLTPRLMPVTVMHDPRTAVGMIADARLVPRSARAQRSRIDTTLGLWRHRFPEVVEEAEHNYRDGTLMQSMECLPAYYDCGQCEQRFPNLGGEEKKNWCAHLAESAAAGRPLHRRLGATTFTGTGLIFGTRGARGAYTEAHLDSMQDEVAAFHAEATRPPTTVKRPRSARTMEISDKEYQDFLADRAKLQELQPKLVAAEETAGKVPELEREVEAEQVKTKAAETDRDAEKAKRERLEEDKRAGELATDRIGKLGKGFLAKLPESITTKLGEQAKTLSDEDWQGRLDELAELTGVKVDDDTAAEGDGGDVLTREETARAAAAGPGGSPTPTSGQPPSEAARSTVVGGLLDLV